MKIIEKKCPNCGADLKFKIGDKEAKCKYCNTEFIIEDNNKDSDNFDLNNVVLNEKFIKAFGIAHLSIFIIISVIAISMFITIGLIIKNEFDTNNKSVEININEIDKNVQEKLYKAAKNDIKIWDSMHRKYELQGDYEDHGYYYLKNKYGIKIIYILKYTYKNDENSKTIYTAFTFSGKSIDSLNYKPFIDTNRIKLDSFDYVYGYESTEELFDNVVRKEKSNGYKIKGTKGLYND